MRRTDIGLGFILGTALLAGAGAASATDYQLLSVGQNPDLVPYATQLRQLLQRNGKACDGITELNAFPSGNGLQTIAACSGGQRYEILFVGSGFQIKSL